MGSPRGDSEARYRGHVGICFGRYLESRRTLGHPAKPLTAIGAVNDGSPTVAIRVGTSIEEVEKLLITKTLELNHGNKPKAAESLGISLKTLYNKLERYEPKG